MCGIFGLIPFNEQLGSQLEAMSGLLRHRGPDDEGFCAVKAGRVHVWGGEDTPRSSFDAGFAYSPSVAAAPDQLKSGVAVGLGHRRLSIVDTSPAGHQPMCRTDKYWLTFNGEIYNFIELRKELEAEGIEFETGSDSEVLLAAYAYWGEHCQTRFEGMWSFAIYDVAKEILFLSRDRFGIKPLYLYQNDNLLAFASEIKAFTALEGWKAVMNVPRVHDFLVWNVLDHTHETMFEGVTQLLPGCSLTVDLRAAGKLRSWDEAEHKQWYDIFRALDKWQGEVSNDAFRAVIKDAVRKHMRSDVTVGSCLSGGLDSSSIVCLAADLLSEKEAENFQTVTAGSEEDKLDETNYAQAVVEFASVSSNITVPTAEDLFEKLDAIIWHQDEPFISSSTYAQWKVFGKAAERQVKVMLDGQGADELMAGYTGFFGAYGAQLLKRGRLLKYLAFAHGLRATMGISQITTFGKSLVYLFPGLVGVLGKLEGRANSQAGWLALRSQSFLRRDPIRKAGGRASDLHEEMLAQVQKTHLPMLLHWEDRSSMAHSIEARVPFLDHRLAELCLSVPVDNRIEHGATKSILRKSLRSLVPDNILDRHDKLGFVTCEERWMKGDSSEKFRALLQEAVELLPTILDRSILSNFDEMIAGKRKFDHRYWRAITLSRWVKLFDTRTEGL